MLCEVGGSKAIVHVASDLPVVLEHECFLLGCRLFAVFGNGDFAVWVLLCKLLHKWWYNVVRSRLWLILHYVFNFGVDLQVAVCLCWWSCCLRQVPM